MSDWARTERVVPTRVEYHVTARFKGTGYSINWVDVQQALNAAVDEYQKLYELGIDAEPSDGAVQVEIGDESIVIAFDKPFSIPASPKGKT
jgi:hypothetical protein